MSGIPDWNYPAFNTAAAQWRAAGYEVINPAEEFDGRTDLAYRTYMEAAIANVLRSDLIVLLPNWQFSRGARMEKAIAEALGMRIIYQ